MLYLNTDTTSTFNFYHHQLCIKQVKRIYEKTENGGNQS